MRKSMMAPFCGEALCVALIICSNWSACAQPQSNDLVENVITSLSASKVEEVQTAIAGLAELTPESIQEFRAEKGNIEVLHSLESFLPKLVEASKHEVTMSVSLAALGSMAQLLGPEHTNAYQLIEDHLFSTVKKASLERRFRDRAGLALEKLPELRFQTLEGLSQIAKNDTEPSKSVFTLLVKNCHREKLAHDALLELSASPDSRKRKLVAQEIVWSRRPGDEILDRLVDLAEGDPDEQVRSWAIGAFRTGYDLPPELSNRLVAILSGTIRNAEEPLENQQLAISSLATLLRSVPEHISVLVDLCTDKEIPSHLRKNAIGTLPFASKYSPDTCAILEGLVKSDDKLISDAARRGLSIMEKRAK